MNSLYMQELEKKYKEACTRIAELQADRDRLREMTRRKGGGDERMRSYRFELDESQIAAYLKWYAEHHSKSGNCRKIEEAAKGDPFCHGAIGGHLIYSFMPTGLGTVAVVTCACGEELNLTDYERW